MLAHTLYATHRERGEDDINDIQGRDCATRIVSRSERMGLVAVGSSPEVYIPCMCIVRSCRHVRLHGFEADKEIWNPPFSHNMRSRDDCRRTFVDSRFMRYVRRQVTAMASVSARTTETLAAMTTVRWASQVLAAIGGHSEDSHLRMVSLPVRTGCISNTTYPMASDRVATLSAPQIGGSGRSMINS